MQSKGHRVSRSPRALVVLALVAVAALVGLARPLTDRDAAAVSPRPAGTEPAPLRYIQFPVLGPVVYSDSFGDCRDGCTRLHHGIDIIGVQMQPLVATTDATVTRIVTGGRNAGNGVVLTDDDGWSYIYYHVNNDPPGGTPEATAEATGDVIDLWRVPPGIDVGARVTAGQVIGWMGNSGNAERSIEHLHFEIRDPERRPVNPFTSLRVAEFYGRCLPIVERPVPITSPPSVVDGTVYRFATAYLDGIFTVSLTGGVLAEGGAAFVGNPNYSVPPCDQSMELPVARSLDSGAAASDQPDLVDPDSPIDDVVEEVDDEPAVPDVPAAPTTLPAPPDSTTPPTTVTPTTVTPTTVTPTTVDTGTTTTVAATSLPPSTSIATAPPTTNEPEATTSTAATSPVPTTTAPDPTAD